MNQSFERGDVVWGEDPFRSHSNPRPWLVLSTDRQSFEGEEYICALMTTTERELSIAVERADWIVGGLSKRSFISPWVPMTLKHEAIVKGQGCLRETFVDRVSEEVIYYVEPN